MAQRVSIWVPICPDVVRVAKIKTKNLGVRVGEAKQDLAAYMAVGH